MVEKAGTGEVNPKIVDSNLRMTLDGFYAWAKGIGHYHATEAVERYRKVIKETKDARTGT